MSTKNNETTYRKEVSHLVEWCNTNNLELNVSKTKEIVVDFCKTNEDHIPLATKNRQGQQMDSYKFLGVNISSALRWKDNNTILNKAHQRLFSLKQLEKCGVSSKSLLRFYCAAAVVSILTFTRTLWFGNMFAEERQINKVVRTASKITRCEVSSPGYKR